MRKPLFLFLTTIALFYCNMCYGQELTVDTFYMDFIGPSAYRRDIVKDINNDTCALIKVQIVDHSVSFPNSIFDTLYGKNEWLVFVSPNSKFLTIQSDSYSPLKIIYADYDIHIKSNRTYLLRMKRVQRTDTIFVINQPPERTRHQRRRPYNSNNSLAFIESMILPGLGQLDKGYYGHGLANMVGEAALVGGTVYFYKSANEYRKQMAPGIQETADNYNSSRQKYFIFLGASAALYAFNLFQAVLLEPKSRSFSFVPSTIPIRGSICPGIELAFSF